MRTEEATLIFNLRYSEAREIEEGLFVIEVDNFPYVILGVNSLPVEGEELSLRVRPADDAGPCRIYASAKHMMLRTESDWLYSYRKGILFNKGDSCGR